MSGPLIRKSVPRRGVFSSMLKVSKLNKYYHNFGRKPLHVINDTTMEIPETGIIAVIGESGAGKTTLINTISGLDAFKNGEISFDDVSMKHYRYSLADKIRIKNFGFIFQNYYLLEKNTVYENVKVALDSFDLSESEKKKRVNYVLNELGISRYTNKLVSSLSGGEQQRVSIARALVKSPRVIFADEPTGSLDEKTTFTVLNILKKVSKKCAVFIATHKRDLISYYADYILELDQGVVVKQFVPEKPESKSLAIDQNIYLPELDHIANINQDNFVFDVYSDHSSKDKASVKIAIKDGKIYLESSENIVFLEKGNEKHLIENERYQIKDYVDDDFNFELEPIKFSNNRISFKQMLVRSLENFKKKSPIKRVLKIVSMLLAVIFVTLIESGNAIKYADLSSDLKSSKGNLYLEVIPTGETMDLAKLGLTQLQLLTAVENDERHDDVRFENNDKLIFSYSGFYQIKDSSFEVPGHDFKHISSLKPTSLVHGKMPSSPFEIVVDEYLLEHLVNTTLLSNMVTNYDYFIGKSFTSGARYNYSLTITGISREKSPTIYGYDMVNFMRLAPSYRARIVDLETAKKYDPASFESIDELELGTALVNSDYRSVTYIGASDLRQAGYFTNDLFDLVINKEDYFRCKQIVAYGRNSMYIVTDGEPSTIAHYRSLINEVVESLQEFDIGVKVNIVYRYQNEVNEATKTLNSILFYVRIATIVITVIALLVILLSTYLSMLNQIGDIAVYRMLGYSRLRLGLIYIIELFLLSIIYTAIGSLSAFLVMFFLDVIPLVPFVMSTPIYQFLLVVLAIPLVVTIIGIIPVSIVFRLTPAQINARFAKKTGSE